MSLRQTTRGDLRGDRPQRYFVEGSGPGVAIDQFAGGDPSGRYAAWISGSRLILRDVVAKSQTDLSALGADARDDESSFSEHRAVSFDPLGDRLAYLRQHGQRQWIVIRELGSGKETVHNPGAGSIWRIAYQPEGQFLSVYAVVADSNGNRRTEWPFPERETPGPACASSVPFYNVWEFPGDDPRHRLLRLSSGQLMEPSGFVMTFGGSYVQRNADNELWLVPESGRHRRITSSVCGGRVLHADSARDAIVVGCASAYGARRDLLIWSSLGRQMLRLDLAAYEVDGRLSPAAQLLPLYPRNEARLLDLQTRTLVALESGDEVLATLGNRALLQRGRKLGFVRVSRRTNHQLAAKFSALSVRRPRLAKIQQRGAYVTLARALFNLADARYAGQFAETPLALSNNGHGLLFYSKRQKRGAVRSGPLHWAAPKRRK